MVILLMFAMPVMAQVALVREGAEQVLELIGKKLGREGVEEATKKIGRAGIDEMLARAAREGGEDAVQSVVRVAGEHGTQALRVLKESPAVLGRALDGMPADMVKPALNAIDRNPQLMTRVVSQYGEKGLELEVEHPGVGASLLEKVGADAVTLGKTLPTSDMARLARHGDDIAKLAPPDKSVLVAAIGKAGGKTVDFIEKHPKLLLTAAGVATIAAAADQLFGASGKRIIAPDGTITEPALGFLDRTRENFFTRFRLPIACVIGGLGAAIILFVMTHVWGAYKLARVKIQLARLKK